MHFPFFSRKKNEKGLIGVDFRASRVAVAHILHAEQSADKPKLKQCAFEVLQSDDVSASKAASQSQALTQLVKPLPSGQFYCNSSIEPTSYELLLIDAPTVESSELKQAVRWRIKDQLSYHIDDSVLDVFDIPGQPSGRAQLMYVVASQKQKINERVEQIKGANLSLQSIDIYELAQRNIASILPEDKDGIVMLRFNEDSGLLTITRNSTLFLTRKIDFGIKRLTQVLTSGIDDHLDHSHEIAEEIELSLDEAALSSGEEESVSEEKIDEEPCLNDEGKLIIDEVILEIQRSLDYYVSHFNQRPVAKIILAPAPKEVPGVVEYINDMLGIQVEVLDFNQLLDIAKPLSRELQSHCFDAIGLALRKETIQGAEG
ncbi:MAG: pilus assembly protein PilM [Gammaproteobacteria bacterium]|nr:pilus assembly protein PilM [Gammaproteobacteria bacterium]